MATDRDVTELVNLLHVPLPIIPKGLGDELTEYLQQLTRTIEENLRRVFGTEDKGDVFIATVKTSQGNGFYDCSISSFKGSKKEKGGRIIETSPEGAGIVLNWPEKISGQNVLHTLRQGGYILCHPIKGVVGLYIGNETLGRTTWGTQA
jgi:hypothetical protein